MGEEMMIQRTDLALRLSRERSCDFLCLVLGATDMAQHYFWSYSAPGTDRRAAGGEFLGDVIPRIYRQADRCLGRLLEVCGPDTAVIVLSDHGGGPAADRAVNTNVWLRRMGLLEVARERQLMASMSRGVLQLLKKRIRRWIRIRNWLPDTLRNRVRQVSFNVASIDWSRTRVYRFPMSPPAEGLVINVAGRQPQGTVQPGKEYERVRARLMEQLQELRDEATGEKLVSAVYRREDLYSGEYAHRAPDLVVLLKEGYRGGTGLQGSLVTPYLLGQVNGQHTLNGILVAAGPHVRRDHRIEGAHILDVAPTLLHALDVPVPEDMDGRVLDQLFTEGYLQSHPVRYSRPLGPSGPPEVALTEEEEETMKEKLRSLGYLS
jgi:predicted AlkP superfamily phosphohydrolase/phosphomutase